VGSNGHTMRAECTPGRPFKTQSTVAALTTACRAISIIRVLGDVDSDITNFLFDASKDVFSTFLIKNNYNSHQIFDITMVRRMIPDQQ